MGGTEEEWRRNADTHKMSPETVEKSGVEASKRPPGQHPGEVLHQRRRLPFTMMTGIQMAIAGFLIVGTIGYCTLYVKAKPEATASDVAKAVTGVSDADRGRQQRK